MNSSRVSKPARMACCRRVGAAAIVSAALLTCLAGQARLSAQNPPPASPKVVPPPDLERLPADVALLVSVRVADLWNSEPIKAMRQQQGQELAEGVKAFEKEIGVAPGDMERATLVISDFKTKGALVFVTTVKPYDRAKVLSTTLSGVKAERRMEQIFFVSDKNQAVLFQSDRSYLISSADAVRAYVDRPATSEGPVSAALQLGQRHQVVGSLNVAAFAREEAGRLPPQVDAFKDLLRAGTAIWTVDLGEQNKVDLRLNFADEAEARRAEKPLRAAIDLARVALAVQESSRQPGDGALKLADAALQTASVAQKGADLQIALSLKADVPAVVATLVGGVHKVRQSANRMQSANNLKQIALAMHNYHDTHGHFPPQAIYSTEGKPLLSWRVLLLPYLEQDALYKQFKLDEAWDGPHNVKLLAQMPKLLADQDVNTMEPVTVYQAFVGPGAFFEGTKGLQMPAEFPDGTSNTLMIIQAGKPVPWTKPEDLPYDANKPVPKLGGHTPGGFNAAFCDGSVRFLSQKIQESVLRALITRNGGETIDPKEF
jgi:prepilin-type processing-associated H-X9-DG protein